jgi:Uma2 family endonuclease
MNAPDFRQPRMTVPEFIAWAERQSDGKRHELVNGKIVAMAPERARHNLAKLAVAIALREAVNAARLSCTVFTDGVAVAINEDTAREPDASVQCGVAVDLDSMVIEAPLIVVEVVSPSSERDDADTKLIEYFSVPSIHHYLIVYSEKRVVVHHRREEGDNITTRIVNEGDIALSPPGMTVSVAALLGSSSSAGAGAE